MLLLLLTLVHAYAAGLAKMYLGYGQLTCDVNEDVSICAAISDV